MILKPVQRVPTPKLKKQLAEQNSEIGKLRMRVNELVDNMSVLENDLNIFKKNVSKDLYRCY